MTGTTSEAEPAKRPARRSDPWKVVFVALFIAGLLAAAVWLLLGSRLLVVRQINVSGSELIDDGEVAAAVGVPTGTPLARVDTDAARGRAEELRLVESAEVHRSWPATLRIEVSERTPSLSVRAADGYQLVDHEGVRIEDADSRPPDYPLVSVRGQIEGNDGVAAAADIASALGGELSAAVDSIDAADPENISVELDGGAAVAWGSPEQNAAKARVLAALVDEHPVTSDREYDVSAPDVAVVR